MYLGGACTDNSVGAFALIRCNEDISASAELFAGIADVRGGLRVGRRVVLRGAGSRGEGSSAETVRCRATSTGFNSRLHCVDPVCLPRGGAGRQAYEGDLK
jgi:hypothetical protein